jgi:hypothetical protein
MMEETTMVKTWGFRISELDVDGTEADSYTASMVRLYKDSPSAAQLQIRHFGPISKSGLGKPRMMMANAVLTIGEMKELAAGLNGIIASIEAAEDQDTLRQAVEWVAQKTRQQSKGA